MSRRILLLCAGLLAWAAGLGSEPCESGPRRVAPYPVWASPAEARVTVLQSPVPASTCPTWWSGLGSPVAVYDATCAADLDASGQNLAAPGTLTLAVSGTAPTIDAAGWTWASAGTLDIPMAPNQNTTILVRFRGIGSGTGDAPLVQGYAGASGRYQVYAGLSASSGRVYFGYGDRFFSGAAGSRLAAGTAGISTAGLSWARYISGARTASTSATAYSPVPSVIGIGPGDLASSTSRICAVIVWAADPGTTVMSAAHTALMGRCP